MVELTEGRELLNRKAIVTGSGGRMGGAIALALARRGADVALNDRLPDRTTTYEENIRSLERDCLSVTANVTRREGAAELIDRALERWGRIDILINTVGGIKGRISNPLWEITEEEWEITVGLNLRGTFHCTQLVLPAMLAQRSGKIVNIASTSWAGDPMHTHYAVAKAGVVAFTRSAATQLGPYNINVNCIAPGATATERVGHETEQVARNDLGGTTPLGRINRPEDIAEAAAYLVSERARNISGQVLTVAGGINPAM
jgi:NAD(P)-dependent dehydrogenase (short-subunit alcohol dehydrogenase family)